jgi:hypothetical protein
VRRRGDAQDPGVEPDGVREPERVAEVRDVPEELAVARTGSAGRRRRRRSWGGRGSRRSRRPPSGC